MVHGGCYRQNCGIIIHAVAYHSMCYFNCSWFAVVGLGAKSGCLKFPIMAGLDCIPNFASLKMMMMKVRNRKEESEPSICQKREPVEFSWRSGLGVPLQS